MPVDRYGLEEAMLRKADGITMSGLRFEHLTILLKATGMDSEMEASSVRSVKKQLKRFLAGRKLKSGTVYLFHWSTFMNLGWEQQ